ncbi:mitochondrial import inner membrane translocase subunit TIM9 [Meredithblackwellia eburnea MCA 4105]
MDASGMNPATAAAFEQLMQQKQMKDFMSLYQNLVERCFTSCCNDFTSKALSSKEESCITSCSDKFLKHSERVGLRFAEQNAELMARGGKRA